RRRRCLDVSADAIRRRDAGLHDRRERPPRVRAGPIPDRDEGRVRPLRRHDLVQPRRERADLPLPDLRRRSRYGTARVGDPVRRRLRRAERHDCRVRIQPEQRRRCRWCEPLRQRRWVLLLLRVHEDGRQGRRVRVQHEQRDEHAGHRMRQRELRRAGLLDQGRLRRADACVRAARCRSVCLWRRCSGRTTSDTNTDAHGDADSHTAAADTHADTNTAAATAAGTNTRTSHAATDRRRTVIRFRRKPVLATLALALMLLLTIGGAHPAAAAPGDLVADVLVPEADPVWTRGLAPSVAFDGRYLYYLDYAGSVLHRIDVPPAGSAIT